MSDRRYVVEYGDDLHRRVGRAPDREPGDFLTKTQATERIIAEMDATIWSAKESRRHAVRILAAERKKAAALMATGVDVETKSAVGSDYDQSRSPSTVSRINAEHGEDRGGRDDNAEAGKRPCVLGHAENRGSVGQSGQMARDSLSRAGEASRDSLTVNLSSSPDSGPDEPECAACGGSGRMGPFFPGGLSTVCGNCAPTSKGSSDE